MIFILPLSHPWREFLCQVRLSALISFLEVNDILKENTTLEEVKIQSGLFLPLSAGGDGE